MRGLRSLARIPCQAIQQTHTAAVATKKITHCFLKSKTPFPVKSTGTVIRKFPMNNAPEPHWDFYTRHSGDHRNTRCKRYLNGATTYPYLRSNSAINAIKASTPASGMAL